MRPLFRILGPLEVERGGPLGGPRQRALLRRLLLSPNRVLSVDRLVDAVWGERAPKHVRESLQVYVSHLRKALPDGAARIRWEQGGYLIAVEEDELDALRFERLVAQGRHLLAAGDARAAAAAFEEALALWRGDVEGDGAAEPEIARLEELRLAADEDRIEASLALGRHRELIPELETLVAEEPLRERPRGQLMLALYRTGRQAEALAVYQDARRSLVDELGLEPSPELKGLEAAILRQDPALAVEPAELRARRHLPAPATALVGREKELSELAALLRGDSPRLVTLTGAGGSGKTRLALQAASALVDRFADGVYFVDLAPLHDPQLVPATIASRLGVEQSGGQPLLVGVKEHLRDKRLLLLLDNFEHVDDAAPVVSELLAEASGLKVLVTSRALLHLYCEHEYPVPPLAEEEALELFTIRAQAVRAGFELDGARPQVLELCRRLDCLPLAIELVAARSGGLSPPEMLAAVPDRLALATRGARDLPARQQTLRATIEWSYGLLDEGEKELCARLAAFAGGCSLAAAQSVCDADLDELASLVEKSLLVETERRDGETRFRMLETIREFAAERLEELPDSAALRNRHGDHYLQLAEDTFAAILAGGSSKDEFDRYTDEEGNLRAALVTLRQRPESEAFGRLCAALFFHWYFRGDPHEGMQWTRAALELDVSEQTRAALENECSGLLYLTSEDGEEALALARSSVERCRRLGDDRGLVFGLATLGNVLGGQIGDWAGALAAYEEAFRISREQPYAWSWWERALADAIGLVHAQAGRSLDALGYLARASALANEAGDEVARALSAVSVALVEADLENWPGARAALAEGLAAAHELGLRPWVSSGLLAAARVEASAGSPLRGARLLGASRALRETARVAIDPIDARVQSEAEAALREALGDSFEAAVREGAAGSLDDAVALALSACAES
jgi:predicted ATPase/DNA-binding SARP family transcriptional activator